MVSPFDVLSVIGFAAGAAVFVAAALALRRSRGDPPKSIAPPPARPPEPSAEPTAHPQEKRDPGAEAAAGW